MEMMEHTSRFCFRRMAARISTGACRTLFGSSFGRCAGGLRDLVLDDEVQALVEAELERLAMLLADEIGAVVKSYLMRATVRSEVTRAGP